MAKALLEVKASSLPLQGCACWAVVARQGQCAVSQAGALSQLWHCLHTWCSVSLSTGVSTHHAWKISCPGIHYSGWDGRGTDTAVSSPPWELSLPSGVLLHGVQPHKDATGAAWWLQGMQFQLVPILCCCEICAESWLFSFPESEGRGSLLVIN